MCRFLCGRRFLTHLCKHQGACLLDHVFRVCLVLQKTTKLRSKAAAHRTFPAERAGFLPLHGVPAPASSGIWLWPFQELHGGVSLLLHLHFPDGVCCGASFEPGFLSLPTLRPPLPKRHISGLLKSLVLVRYLTQGWPRHAALVTSVSQKPGGSFSPILSSHRCLQAKRCRSSSVPAPRSRVCLPPGPGRSSCIRCSCLSNPLP